MKKKAFYCALFIGAVIFLTIAMAGPLFGRASSSRDADAPKKLTACDYTNKIILVYRDTSVVRAAVARKAGAQAAVEARLEKLRAATSMNLRHARFMSGDGHVLYLPKRMTLTEARQLAVRLMKDPSVKYAEPDVRMFPAKVPNDYLYDSQWHYHAAEDEPGAVNLPAAWDITTGSASIVVAVIDTGYLPHEDVDQDRIVPGYDFISEDLWEGSLHPYTANDGHGRDPDPTDTGDWITQEEHDGTDVTGGFFKGCGVSDSSWHGTHVAGTIGAKTDNADNYFPGGAAGIDWKCKILHARVLGKCGGYMSDIVDAIRWSVGISVHGVPDNVNPAKVLNLSLGGEGTCGEIYQDAIDEAISRGAVVVVASGNENEEMSKYSPANCNGVIAVAAVNRKGGRAPYSNYGTGVTIAAPGGDTSLDSDDGVWSLLNYGLTYAAIPDGDTYHPYQGTSMAAPHVSGVISLLLSHEEEEGLTPGQIRQRIQATARAFPTGTGRDCTKATCGAGIIDAAALLMGNPVPSIVSLCPSSRSKGTGGFTLTVNGENFSYSSVVRWEGEDRQTTYVSPTRLKAAITAEDIAEEGNSDVTVFTSAPGGGTTDELTFEVKKVIPVGGGSGGCFIATAAFGSPMEKHVRILQDFRDRRLLTNAPGKAFVKFYYEVSPAIAVKISQSAALRFATRAALMPLAGAAYLTVHHCLTATLLATIIVLSLFVFARKRRARRRAM